MARGGGSLEDFAPFNTEIIARAIVASRIPVVSAIGHETDFTIADFVADVRAPTPSAAAQMVVPIKIEVNARITNLQVRCVQFLNHQVELQRRELSRLTRSLVHPSKKIQDLQMRIDDLSDRLSRAAVIVLQLQKATLEHMTYSFMKISPRQRMIQLQALTEKWDIRLQHAIRVIFKNYKQRYSRLLVMLTILNPKAVLQKGYSITRTIPHRLVVTSAGKYHPCKLWKSYWQEADYR